MRVQLRERPDRARLEVATAVGADSAQHVVRAAGAERALEGADACVGAVGRQIDVAALAVGAQLEHPLSVVKPVVSSGSTDDALDRSLRQSGA
jgi:hypothetical protein